MPLLSCLQHVGSKNLYQILSGMAILGTSLATIAILALKAMPVEAPARRIEGRDMGRGNPSPVNLVSVRPTPTSSSTSLSKLEVTAQAKPPAGVTMPKPTEPPQIPTAPLPSLPQPRLQTPSTPQPPVSPSPSGERFLVKKVEVLGSTVLHKQIAALIKNFENHELTFEDLIRLRSAITQLYINRGYVTSGAFLLNAQNLSSGVVQIQVVEGELERIEISGLGHLQAGYVRNRIALAVTKPLNRYRLEEALQLLQLNPLIAQINAELTAGSTPARSVLQVRLKEAPAVHAGLSVDNNQTPSIGSNQIRPFFVDDDLFGFGDRLSAEYGNTSGLNTYNFSYNIPVNARNGTVSVRYTNFDARVIEAPFQNLGIRSKERTLSVGFRQPLVELPTSEFALGLSLDLRRERTFILDNIPFSFTASPENGKSKLTVLRFSQDWVNRGSRRVLAARSQFNVGLNALGATVNNTGTDGRFFSWTGQFQYVQSLGNGVISISRVATQLTPDSLLPIEQFSTGGIDTVRGYRQNQLVTDNAILGSFEIRVPVTSSPNILQLRPFFDIGTTWNNRESNPSPSTIASLGLGLSLAVGSNLNLSLDYGIPLIAVHNQGHSLQNDGLYFAVQYQHF